MNVGKVQQVLMIKEGIDEAWQSELIDRLNDVSEMTGVVVRPDKKAEV